VHTAPPCPEGAAAGADRVVRGGRVIKATNPPSPNPTSIPVTLSTTRNEVATTRKKGKTAKSMLKFKVGPKQALATKANKSAEPRQPSQTTPKELLVPTRPNQSPVEEISDLLDKLPLSACVELTRRLLISIPTLPFGPARTRAVLRIVILFVAEYGSTTQKDEMD